MATEIGKQAGRAEGEIQSLFEGTFKSTCLWDTQEGMWGSSDIHKNVISLKHVQLQISLPLN